MSRIANQVTASVLLAIAIVAAAPRTWSAPPARKIPGINAPDAYAKACVDCHVAKPQGTTTDARLSTALKQWQAGKVDAALLAKAQGSAPVGLKLKGKHPAAEDSLEDVPNGCLECHSDDSKKAPPLGAMVHRIHLTGGEQNKFMTVYQGECTHCHKLNANTGAWTLPSGPEKP